MVCVSYAFLYIPPDVFVPETGMQTCVLNSKRSIPKIGQPVCISASSLSVESTEVVFVIQNDRSLNDDEKSILRIPHLLLITK